MTSRALLVVLAAAVGVGCASSDPPVTGRDAGRPDANIARDGGPDDATLACPSGQHVCGGGCITDQPNDPMHGCRLGCGQPCPTPSMGVGSCSSSGACDFTCPSPFHRLGDRCTCTPVMCADIGYRCGAPDNGCGTPLNCGTCMGGAMCIGGNCACMPDAHEPNNSSAVATREPELNDGNNPNVTFSDFNIHNAADVDWLTFHVVDGALHVGGPHLTVRLYGIPIGSDYDLGVWFACDNGRDSSSCTVGTPDNMIGNGCTSSHPGIAEENVDLPTHCGSLANASGNVFIRVTAPTFGGTCQPYSLDVRVR